MSITIVPNTFSLSPREMTCFSLNFRNIQNLFRYYITDSHIVFTAKTNALDAKTFYSCSIDFGHDFLKPFIVFEFIRNPSIFDCRHTANKIIVSPKTSFSTLDKPFSMVYPRIERELAQLNSAETRDKIRRTMLSNFLENPKPPENNEFEVIPLLNLLRKPVYENIFKKLTLYRSCTAFVKKLIYERYEPADYVETHFKKHSSCADIQKVEYTTAIFEYFLLGNKKLTYVFYPVLEVEDVELSFALKYLNLISTSSNALEIVRFKYFKEGILTSCPLWLQIHILKEHLSAPLMIEINKESCLYHLLAIYIDLKMEQCENPQLLKRLIILRASLPHKERFVSEDGRKLVEWITQILQSLHNNDYWSSSLRQKVQEISDALGFKWTFPDTFKEAYYPALYYEAKSSVLPFQSIVDTNLAQVIFHPQNELFYYPVPAICGDRIFKIHDALHTFLQNPDKILVIEGKRGSGKTLSLIRFADKLLSEYSDSRDFIPYIHFNKQQKDPEFLQVYKEECHSVIKKIPFLFIIEDISSFDETPYIEAWIKEYPNAKFVFSSRSGLKPNYKHLTCRLASIGQDEFPDYYSRLNKEKPLRYPPETYIKALSYLHEASPFHMHLMAKLLSRSFHPDHPGFKKKLERVIETIEIEWDNSKGFSHNHSKITPSLISIINWFKKLNRSPSDR